MPQTNKRSSSNVGFRIATTSQLPFPVHFTIFLIEPAQAQSKLNLKNRDNLKEREKYSILFLFTTFFFLSSQLLQYIAL